MPEDAALRDLLFRIERDLGEIKGNSSGLLREMSRMNGQIELHLAEDTKIHAAQDERLLNQLLPLSARITALEQARAQAEGERAAARNWSEWIRLSLGAAIGAAVAWFGTAPWRH